MDELYYSPLDIAAIIAGMDIGCRKTASLTARIWKEENDFILPDYREDKRKFILEVFYWMNYLSDKAQIDSEFPAIAKDMLAVNSNFEELGFIEENLSLDLFFKNVRLRILYGGGKDYVRVKRRTLMSKYGYKKMSFVLAGYFDRCMEFYHLKSYVRGNTECKIQDSNINDMLIFRLS